GYEELPATYEMSDQQSLYIVGTTSSQPIVLYPRHSNPVNMQIDKFSFQAPNKYSSMFSCMEIP
ncbi:4610_t:CDS:2, partial [Dentiscutata heterogama]